VKQDYAEALRWYRRAADAGEVTAMINIGGLHEAGLGVRPDHDTALLWYRCAVDADHERAAALLQKLEAR
jgi:hypothetical protein